MNELHAESYLFVELHYCRYPTFYFPRIQEQPRVKAGIITKSRYFKRLAD